MNAELFVYLAYIFCQLGFFEYYQYSIYEILFLSLNLKTNLRGRYSQLYSFEQNQGESVNR